MRTLIITWYEADNKNVVEEIQDISDLPDRLQDISFEKLQGLPESEQTILPRDRSAFYSLRAMYNIHRKYKQYGIAMPNYVTDDMIFDNFEGFVTLIKSKGINLPL